MTNKLPCRICGKTPRQPIDAAPFISIPRQLALDIQEYLWWCSELKEEEGIYHDLTNIINELSERKDSASLFEAEGDKRQHKIINGKNCVKLKKTIKRGDCRNTETNPYSNSVIFEAHVNRVYQNLFNKAEYLDLESLTGFLKTVEIEVL